MFISLEKNKIKDISATNLTEFQINDATFVESPLYIHLLDILASAQTLKEKDTALLYSGRLSIIT